jgi:Fe-S-cluster-containing dehydrogenase component/formate-dependent nitrite reductase membrane component NrfD
MRYGFAMDQRTCIGCHACTVACKTEHEVPLGQFRTWVKYVEKGEFPATTREFGVMRCNHCTDAPCVTICPTKALFKRDDGIVDFDRDRCIGCKSCMQGCPYDAIYIDKDSNTAAKCNFCAHRIDEGIEPACVTVCPTHSIWVGDLDDPTSGISKLVNNHPTSVRSPEQNTGPNVFYLGADRAVLEPLDAPVDDTYIWSTPDGKRAEVSEDLRGDAVSQARTTYNAASPRPWGWRVTTYLWTKGISAGAMMIAALASLLGVDLGVVGTVVAPALALFMVAATGVLLVTDLKRPERFLYIFLKPNPSSWLFWGSVVLAAQAGVVTLWLACGIAGEIGALDTRSVYPLLSWLVLPAAVMTAGYTGFLFGQAEGRDLWQSPLLFWHLQPQALMVGAGALALLVPFLDLGAGADRLVVRALVVGAVAHVAMLVLEYKGRHATRHAAAAAHMVTNGRYARLFWAGAVTLPLLAAALASVSWNGGLLLAAFVAGLLVQVALLVYEGIFVRAGQDVPLS